MKVFVTGGTGEIGRPAVAALRELGHAVQVSSRSLANDELILELGGIPVRVDLQDRESVVAAVADADAVVHLATHIPPTDAMGTPARWRANDLLRREATSHLIDAAVAARAQVMVLQSYFAVAPPEETPLPAASSNGSGLSWSGIEAMASMRDAEADMARLDEAGIRGVTVRFGSIYSETSEQLHAQVRALTSGDAVVAGSGTNYWPFVHSHDAGQAVAHALDLPTGIYEVADLRPTTLNEFWEMAAEALDAPPPRRGEIPSVHPMAPILLGSWRGFDGSRFRELSGWHPAIGSVLEGWPPAAKLFLSENTPRRRRSA